MYKLNTLKNGLRVVTVPMSGTKTATVLVLVGTGSKYETREQGGLSHFLEHMFFKGTKKRPNTLALSAELDAIGAEFNAFTSKEYTGYYVKAHAGKLELAMDVVSDMLTNSKFDAREIEREKGVIIEELNMYNDNPTMHIEDVFENCLYGDTPAGRDTIGTRKSILSFQRPDFMRYLRSQYNARNSCLLVVGNLPAAGKLERLADKYFDTSSFSERGGQFREKEPVGEAQKKPAVLASYKKTDQAHLSLGVRAYGWSHPDKTVLRLLAVILGGSMSSRLFINLRERQGLAYYVRTSTENYTDSGYLTTTAGVPADRIEAAIKTILAEYKKIASTPVGATELKRAQDMIAGRLAIQLESSDDVANYYARQAVLGATLDRTQPPAKRRARPLDTPEAMLKKLKAVKPGDLKRVAGQIFRNQGLNLAVIGPYHDTKQFNRILKV